MKCTNCDDCFWVCENHDDRPWDGDRACECGGAGMPCPKCNPSKGHHDPPKPLAGSTTIWDINRGWLQ